MVPLTTRATAATRAFTLVETIFSSLFISLTVLAIINLYPGAYLSVRKSEALLQCDLLANSILEDLRSTRFADLPDVTGKLLEEQTIGGVLYSPRLTIFKVPGTEEKMIKGVKLQIRYRVRDVEREPEVYETYLHALGQ